MSARGNEAAERAVTLSPDDVRHAVRLLELLTARENRGLVGGGEPPAGTSSKDGLLAVARFSYLARQARAQHFSPAMFGEPPWDVLLALYLKDSEGVVPTISCVAKDAGIAMSTAFRWIDYLEKKRLISREPNTADGRSSTVTLTEEGRSRLESYLTDVLIKMAATRDEISREP